MHATHALLMPPCLPCLHVTVMCVARRYCCEWDFWCLAISWGVDIIVIDENTPEFGHVYYHRWHTGLFIETLM